MRFFSKEARKVAVCRGVGLLISVHKEAPVTRIGCPLRELLPGKGGGGGVKPHAKPVFASPSPQEKENDGGTGAARCKQQHAAGRIYFDGIKLLREG